MLGAFGKFSAKEFSVTLKANNLPANLNVFPFVFDGRFAGDISLFGPYASPVGKAQFDLKRIAIPGIDETRREVVVRSDRGEDIIFGVTNDDEVGAKCFQRVNGVE